MDEETAAHQRNFDMAIVRQYDLWWHDFYYLLDCVEKNNAQAWIWSDYIWNHTDEFLAKMPKTVVQNNWYYSNKFTDLDEKNEHRVRCYDILDAHGYDQIPAGSVFSYKDNFHKLAEYSKEHISKEHLIGMMQTVWERVDDGWMDRQAMVEESIAETKKWFEEN